MHRRIAVAAVLTTTTALALGAAGAAPAQSTTAPPASTTAPPATTTAPPTTTPPAPAPAKGTLGLTLEKVNGKSASILAGDRFRVRGTVKPYVPGQKVVVRFYRGEKKLASKQVTVRSTKGGNGSFVLGYKAKKAGHITVRASHRATAELATLVAKGRGVDVLPLHASPGAKGLAVRVLQTKLKALGYVIGQKGVYDGRTARAVLAFRKVTGMARTMNATEDVFRKLAKGAGHFKVRFPKQGKHVEADLSLQVLALIRGSKVERIYPISSGKPSTPTILGTFKVYSKTPGTNAKGMVYTSYFRGGYGIHGYAEVPIYAASHGCLRTPVPDAVPIFNWISYGDPVDVYL
jgi:lipoprotein-anchoring transpeptidase ErfK/SrfK